MIRLRTTNGEMFDIDWIGISSIDGILRFAVKNPDISNIVQVFSVPENCSILTRLFDEDEHVYEGFIVFRGFLLNFDGTATVSMSKI